MACWARSSMLGGQVGVAGDGALGVPRGCRLRGGPPTPGAPVNADPEPRGWLHGGRALAAPRWQLALAGGVAVSGPGLGGGTFASVYQNLRFDARRLSRLPSRSTGILME